MTVLLAGMLGAGAIPSATAAPPVPAQAPAPSASPVAAATDGSDDVSVEEVELAGIDADAQTELAQVDAAFPDTVQAEPDTSPGLEVADPIGVLADDAVPDVITEQMSVEPFSLMGVTWDLDPSLVGVVVQYRTFTGGAWTAWGWAAPTEEYIDEGTVPTRGATDAIYVPDSSGVQVIVSSVSGTVSGVKVLLIDPGAGPEGTGASVSSGTPTDAPVPTPSDPAVPLPTPDPADVTTPDPTQAPTAPPTTAPVPDEPAAPVVPSPTPDPAAPVPTEPEAPATEDATSSSAGVDGAEATVTNASYVSQTLTPAKAVSTDVDTRLATAAIGQPRIIGRAEWGASAPACSGGYGSATLAASIHHTASSNSYSAGDVPGILRGFLAYHMTPEAAGGRGWCDIGYNFLVDKFGNIYEGRAGGIDMPVLGVHTAGFNSRVIGVSAIGNYQEAVPTVAMAEAISQVIAWKFAQHGILANSAVTLVSGGGASKFPEGTAVSFNTIFGHRDAQLTSCPGQYLYNIFGDIRNRVAGLSNPVVAESPFGAVDVVRSGYGSVRVAGWAKDPSTAGSITLQVLVDGVAVTQIAANQSRADVGAYAYDSSIAVSGGTHTLCLRMLNVGGGSNVHLGCFLVTPPSGAPIGVIDTVSATADGIYVSGWARDPESANPIDVHVYANAYSTAVTANQPRPDVQQTAPGQAGPNHGFVGSMTLPAGAYNVCFYGIGVGSGGNALLGCRNVTVTGPVNHAPIGVIDAAEPFGGTHVRVSGWAMDPDTQNPIAVHAFVDGRLVEGTLASISRGDVGAAYGNGPNHGYQIDVPTTPGHHQVCMYGIDSAGGFNPLLTCRNIYLSNATPIGVLDSVTALGGSQVRVSGWAFDHDTLAPIAVHVYVDGRVAVGTLASTPRADVDWIYRMGVNHGFEQTFSAAPGQHTVCVYGIDSAGRQNPLLGCRAVNVS